MGVLYHLRPTQTDTWGQPQIHELAKRGLEETEREGDIELQQLLQALSVDHSTPLSLSTTHTVTLGLSPYLQKFEKEITQALADGAPISLRRPNDVPLHSLLRFGAVLSVATSVGSLAMWLHDIPPLINPFTAILAIVASPFFYAMGNAARLK